jgi:hypothetical protein
MPERLGSPESDVQLDLRRLLGRQDGGLPYGPIGHERSFPRIAQVAAKLRFPTTTLTGKSLSMRLL